MVSNGAELWSKPGTGKVAYITAMFLPEYLQRRGFGGAVIRTLLELWRESDVVEIQANVKTEAGAAAFSSWGFHLSLEPDMDLPGWYYCLQPSQHANHGH